MTHGFSARAISLYRHNENTMETDHPRRAVVGTPAVRVRLPRHHRRQPETQPAAKPAAPATPAGAPGKTAYTQLYEVKSGERCGRPRTHWDGNLYTETSSHPTADADKIKVGQKLGIP